MTEAVRRVALVAERNTPVRLAFSEGQIELSAGDGSDAQAEEVIEADFTGAGLTMGFNPQYLLDGLGVLSSEKTRIALTSPAKPGLLTAAEEEPSGTPKFRYLLMPIRLG